MNFGLKGRNRKSQLPRCFITTPLHDHVMMIMRKSRDSHEESVKGSIPFSNRWTMSLISSPSLLAFSICKAKIRRSWGTYNHDMLKSAAALWKLPPLKKLKWNQMTYERVVKKIDEKSLLLRYWKMNRENVSGVVKWSHCLTSFMSSLSSRDWPSLLQVQVWKLAELEQASEWSTFRFF